MVLTKMFELCSVENVMNVLKQKTLSSVLLALLVVASVADASEPRNYIARAFSMSTGEVLYTEHHQELWAEGKLIGGSVEYLDAAGRTFARKALSFDRGLFAPSFSMIDERDGFREGASWSADGLRLFALREGDGRERLIEEPPAVAVVDAGFHRYMQAALPSLIAGKGGEFSFAVPSFGRFVKFRVEMVDRDGPDRIRLRMKPSNAFLRLLADPIELVYDSSGRLLVFEGVTNIPDEAGERHLARIVFEYPSTSSEESGQQVAAAG
jgi:hypothetical protein